MRARFQLNSALAIVALVVSILLIDPDTSLRELVAPALAAVGAMLVISAVIALPVSRRLLDLTDVTRSLARGDTTARPPLTGSGEIGELGTALGRLAEHLASRTAALQHEDAVLASVIEALDEGVVQVSARRDVTRINPAARAILGVTRHVPFVAEFLPRTREFQAALEGALAGKVTDPVETTIGSRTVSLSARPIAAGGGIVIALFDLTGMRRLENVRRDFVANVSHELRTPLTVITGFAETLAEDDAPPELKQQFAATIRAHAERMQRIVDDLLDLSRLESGKWEPQVEELYLPAIADDIVATYHERAHGRGLVLEARIGDDSARIQADATAVRQVLSNLVDNAVRHTETGGVTLFGIRSGNGTWIGVRDTGPGIDPVHIPRIFERFYRADPGRARNDGGTGLGLSIVRHLVEAHGGSVKAESTPGHGTTISAFFPDR